MNSQHTKNHSTLLGSFFVVCVVVGISLLSDEGAVMRFTTDWNSGFSMTAAVAASTVTAEQRAYCEYGQQEDNEKPQHW